MKENAILAEPRTKESTNGNGLADDLFKRQLLASLIALQEGDFSTRMPGDLTGLDGKIADAFNKVVGRVERFGNSLNRLRTEVGRKGKFDERLSVGDAVGGWSDATEAVNSLADDLSRPTLEMGRVIGAVAKGDLSQSVSLEISGQPLQGEYLRTAKLVNGMVEQLAGFSVEVIRVAREVASKVNSVARRR
jgi:methyl-accepting chemotaxis protein